MSVKVTDSSGATLQLSLQAKYIEYNCGIKMGGRLEPSVSDDTGKQVYSYAHAPLFEAHKAEIINDFAKRLQTASTFSTLNTQNPLFPGDTGRYLPTMILYADALTGKQFVQWYSNFRGLIYELEENPQYGWKVVRLPLFSNNYYAGWSLHPSCVWGIVPPHFADLVFTPGTKIRKNHLDNIKILNEATAPARYIEELKKLAG